MKLAELKAGEVYAIGSASSRYLKHVGLVLDTRTHLGPGRYAREVQILTPSTDRPAPYERRDFGIPVATIGGAASEVDAQKLAKIDPAKVKLVLGRQVIGRVSVYVVLVPLNQFRNTYAQWAEDQKAATDARAAYQKVLADRTAENERVAAGIKKLLPRDLSVSFDTRADHSMDKGSIVIRNPAAFLAFLQERSS